MLNLLFKLRQWFSDLTSDHNARKSMVNSDNSEILLSISFKMLLTFKASSDWAEIFSCLPNADLLYNLYFMHGYLISTPNDWKVWYKIFATFCKNNREGGAGGGASFFSWSKEGTRVSHAKFQVSMLIRSLTVVFCKNDGGGGEKKPITLAVH